MRHYAVFQYAFDATKNEHTDIKGPVQAFVEAENAFEACEKAGLDDPTKYFADQISEEQFNAIMGEIKKEGELNKKLEGQMQGWIDARDGEQKKNEFVCPNCGGKLNKAHNCKACGFGLDTVAVGDVIIDKKELDKAIRKAKRIAKKNQTAVTP